MGRPVLVLPEATQAELRRLHGLADSRIVNTFISLLDQAGWGFQPTATALNMHRQSVLQRAKKATGDSEVLAQLPPVPHVPVKEKLPEDDEVSISGVEVVELRRLNFLAQQLRSEHRDHDPRRRASEELSRLIDELTQRGVTYRQIGLVLDVEPMTVRARLKRHGYRKTNPGLRPYRGFRPDQEEVST